MKIPELKLFLLLIFFSGAAWAQPIISPGKGIEDVKIGSTPDEIVWALGFKGLKLTKEGVAEVLKVQAEMLGIDFDYVYNYQHIMALPVSTVYFKDDKAVIIVISSYPEYNEVLCLGIKTSEGLNFWDGESEMKKLYGKNYESKSSDFQFYFYRDKGLSVSVDGKDIRTMSIFKNQP